MRQIGCYYIDDKPLARGGMGQIFLGKDAQGHEVVVKEILPEFANDWSVVSRIEKEVEFLVKVDHPSIVKLYSAFRDEQAQCYYIVMEYVKGLNVEQYVQRYGAMPAEKAIVLMTRMLDAIQCIHNACIIHRDIKPSNIMIRPDDTICLLDFGVAKDVSANAQSNTIIGSVIGTTGYMSPEQANGFGIDYRSDIYSLGCVFYYMLTGHHALNQLPSDVDITETITRNDIPPLKKYVKGLPNFLQGVIDKATQSNMSLRYQTCYEFLGALSNGTMVTGSKQVHTKISVTIGREMCDIIINDSQHKISRHHADVELVPVTGGMNFVFTDCSANGSLVNQKKVFHQQVFISYRDPAPAIYLAGIPEGALDWNLVKEELFKRAKAIQQLSGPDDPQPGNNPDSPAAPQGRQPAGGNPATDNPPQPEEPQYSFDEEEEEEGNWFTRLVHKIFG